VALLFAKLFYVITQRWLLKFIKKTETDLDNELLIAIKGPFYFFIFITGLYFAIKSVSYAAFYIEQINKVYSVLLIIWMFVMFIRVVNALARWYIKEKRKTKFESTAVMMIKRLVNLFIYIIAFIIILDHMGVEITPLVTGLGIGGLAVALALQNTLSNYFAGIYIITDKSIRIGDYIQISDHVKGIVEKVGWRSTKVRAFKDLIVIPNSKLAESTIKNYSQPAEAIALGIPFGVSYKSNLQKVEKAAMDVAKRIIKKEPGAKKDAEPFVRFKEFGESNIRLSLIIFPETYIDKFKLRHELIKALKKEFDKKKIEISFPTRKVYIGKKKVK